MINFMGCGNINNYTVVFVTNEKQIVILQQQYKIL